MWVRGGSDWEIRRLLGGTRFEGSVGIENVRKLKKKTFGFEVYLIILPLREFFAVWGIAMLKLVSKV